eukprot:6470818-Amphidinium_carterae.3
MGTPAKSPSKRKALNTAWESLMSTQKAPRKLKECEIGEQVRHALSDSCKWATCLERDGIVVNGMTLRQRLWDDKVKASKGEGITFGHNYYKQLRRLYTSCDKIEQELDALTDESYSPCDELLLACAACLRNIPNRSDEITYAKSSHTESEKRKYDFAENCLTAISRRPWPFCRSKLLDYVSTATVMSRQDAIGILKLLNDFTESGSTDQMHACMTLVSHLARLKVWESHEDLLAMMKQKIDGTLCEADLNGSFALNDLCEVWLRSKCPSNKPQSWLEGHRREWRLVLPEPSVDKILAAGEDIVWPEQKDEVASIIRSSGLGKHIFSFVMKDICEAMVQSTIEKHVAEIKSRTELKEDDVVACRNAIKTEILGLPGIGELVERREVVLLYRGWKVKAWTRSLEEQVAMSVQSVVRGWLSQLSLIPRLPGESVLASADDQLRVTTVDAVLYRDAKVAREHLQMVMNSANVKEGALVKACIVINH